MCGGAQTGQRRRRTGRRSRGLRPRRHRERTATLLDIVESVLAGRPIARPSKIASRHRFVVRLRDGSRHFFDEAKPRTSIRASAST